MPPMDAGEGEGVMAKDVHATIVNMTEYRTLTNIALQNSSLRVVVRGSTRVKFGVLYAQVMMNKTISVPGRLS
jgi:hypothetical protein